jgi:hypothetical protein
MSAKQDVRIAAKTRPKTIDMYREWERLLTVARDGRCASFFHPKTVPEQFRSKTYIDRDGQTHKACTIDDVVRWSFTARGGKQLQLPGTFEEDDAHLPCQSGYCE